MSHQRSLVAAFYKFVSLPDYEERKAPLQALCDGHGIKGTILLAREGINSTIAGDPESMESFLAQLQSDPAIGELTIKRSYADEPPFHRMKVRLKQEIVRLGLPEVNPNDQVGEYVEPEDWNQLISDPDVILVDTRNDYEIEIGSFQGAIDPKTKSFREFPSYEKEELADKKDRPIAMFCTGGIRCEKSTSYLLREGYKKVYHLKGGILNYLEKVAPENSMWEGECFVFDDRVTVDHNLDPGDYDMCHACRHAISEADKEDPRFVEGVSCPYCHDKLTDEQRDRAAQRQKQIELSKSMNRKHIGITEQDRQAWREEKLLQRKKANERDPA